jgi:hypothetical protein
LNAEIDGFLQAVPGRRTADAGPAGGSPWRSCAEYPRRSR